MRNPSISDITKKTQRYWFEDGIWEIGFGLANLLLGIFFYLIAHFQITGLPIALGQMLVMVAVFLGMGQFVKALKERITYPRTGYVSYRKPAVSARLKRILLSIGVSAGTAALVGFTATVQLVRNTPALVSGILLAAALVYLGRRFQLTRLYLLAALTVLLGYSISLLNLTDTPGMAVFFAAFGLLMTTGGGITLLLYLRQSRRIDESEPGDEDMVSQREP